ncbi:MAG: thiamine pyrophosphate-dependent enzyme [bacterium]
MDSSHENLTPPFGDGNEAIAWGAADAGLNFFSHYPGAPVNRVAEAIAATALPITVNHALNEHVAALAALGASLCGARSLVVMKHVGLNIAADPLNYAGAVKITGGMVVVVGTDPGARCSTGEEDVHWYAPQFNVPLLEPASVQGVYDSVLKAFELSEKAQLPVLIFVPGRIAYQAAAIQRRMRRTGVNQLEFKRDRSALTNVGSRAVQNHRDQVLRMAGVAREAAPTLTMFNPGAGYGIVTRGATYAVVCEVIEDLHLADQVHLLNIERTFPLHTDSFLAFARGKHKILVIEDQDGFLETLLKREAFGAVACAIQGKAFFPAWGEISFEQIRNYFRTDFGLPDEERGAAVPLPAVPDRPGACCEGCPHRPTLFAIAQALRTDAGILGGDIGCSSLPPHRADWLLCMNAGLGLAQGIAQTLPQQLLVSTGGDGSLFHGGLLSLQSAVENGINLIHVVLDNQSVAMTGHQNSPTSTGRLDARGLLRAIGVKHVFVVKAFTPALTLLALEKARHLDGVRVIWVRGRCALQGNPPRQPKRTLRIDAKRCGDCTLCYAEFQCPAIVRSAETSGLRIDALRCRGCGACLDVCPNHAILTTQLAPVLVSKLLGVARSLRRLSFRLLSR